MNPIIFLKCDFNIVFFVTEELYFLHGMCIFPILVTFPRQNGILIFSTHSDLKSPGEVVNGMWNNTSSQ